MGGVLLAGSTCASVGQWRWNLVLCGVFFLAQQPPLTGPLTGHWERGMKRNKWKRKEKNI